MSINRPSLQAGPVAWTAFCIVGIALGTTKVVQFAPMTSGWLGGLFVIAMFVAGFLAAAVWWGWAQAELTLDDQEMTVRRWLTRLLGRPPTSIRLAQIRHAAFVIDRGKFFEVTTDNGTQRWWAALWPPSAREALTDALRDHGVRVEGASR